MKCPFCGNLMHRAAVRGRSRSGKLIVIYICSNKAKCGAIVDVEEDG